MEMSQNDWQNDRPLVLDTNTALSGLIGGVSRKLVFELERNLYYPEPSLDEIKRNRGIIQERAGLSATATDELIERLFRNVTLVSDATVVRHLDTAANAASPHPDADQDRPFSDRDEADVVFLSAAIDGDVWSDDGVFKHQRHVGWYRTEDVVECANVDV